MRPGAISKLEDLNLSRAPSAEYPRKLDELGQRLAADARFSTGRLYRPHTNASNSSTSRSICFIPAAQKAFSRGFSPNGASAST